MGMEEADLLDYVIKANSMALDEKKTQRGEPKQK